MRCFAVKLIFELWAWMCKAVKMVNFSKIILNWTLSKVGTVCEWSEFRAVVWNLSFFTFTFFAVMPISFPLALRPDSTVYLGVWAKWTYMNLSELWTYRSCSYFLISLFTYVVLQWWSPGLWVCPGMPPTSARHWLATIRLAVPVWNWSTLTATWHI